ncbi:MAG: DUF6263 family protein [Sphingobacteriales bacterium JAD_PAG50586_3]|nr:MAG: DUF6263 family protein [Sphingobacteriales bacterium JAD_PAG50586_3]
MKKYILLPLLFVCCVAFAQPTYSFKSDWKKGQRFYFESVADQDISMDGGVNNLQTIATGFTLYVKEVKPSGNKVCHVTYDKLQITSSVMQSMGIQDAVDKAMAGLYGLGYIVEVTPEGKCMAVTGATDMLRDYGIRMFPGYTPEDKFKRDEFIAKMTAQYNDSTLKAEFEDISGSFMPDAPVKLNDTWTKVTNTKLVINKTTLHTYKLEAIDGNIATVSVVTSSKTGGTTNFAGIDLAPDLTVEGNGIYKIDLTTGLAQIGDLSLTAKGTMENMGKVASVNIQSKIISSQKEIK